MNWAIRKANPKDSDAILHLLKESFRGYWTASQSVYSQEFWNWLYQDNPAGGSLTFIAESNNRIVAHFPNVLELLKVNEKVYLAGVVLHLTTHPDYRRKGIFKDLGKLSLEELSSLKIPFSTAFPNDKSRPGFINKLGFSPIVTLPLLIKPLRIKNILNAVTKRPMLASLLSYIARPIYHSLFYNYRLQRKVKNLKIEEKENFGPEFDFFWKKAMSQAKVMVLRDSAFLNWRFILRPNQKYQTFVALRNAEVIGYTATRRADLYSLRVGIIMDFLTLPGVNGIFDSLLNKVFDSFKKDDIDLCITACLNGNIYYRNLRNQGFIPIPAMFNPRKLVLVGRINQDIADKRIFFNKKNWFLSFADWDVF